MFSLTVYSFHKQVQEDIKAIEKQHVSMAQMLKDTMEYLVEDPDCSSEDFFAAINDFLLNVEVSSIWPKHV